MQTDVDLSVLRGATTVAPQAARADSDTARRNRRRLALQTWGPLVVTAALAGVLALWFLLPMLEPVTTVRTAPVIVRTDVATAGGSSTAVIASGWLEPDPYPTAVPPLVAGVIATLPVVEGTTLVKGETIIATLDTTLIDADIERQRAIVEMAEADVAMAAVQIDNATAMLEQNLAPRMAFAVQQHTMSDLMLEENRLRARVASLAERLKQNGPARMAVTSLEASIASIDASVAELNGTIASLVAEISYLEQNAAAYEKMAQATAASQIEAVQQRAKLAMAREQHRAALVGREALVQQREAAAAGLAVAREVAAKPTDLLQEYEEAKTALERQLKLVETHRVMMDIAREGMNQPVELRTKLADATAAHRVAQARLSRETAQLAVLQVRREAHVIRSPIDGEVMRVLARPGMPVSPLMSPGEDAMDAQRAATVLIDAFRPGELQAKVDMPLGDVPAIRAGQRVEVTCESVPGRTFEGKVLRLVRQADVARNTLQVKVQIVDPDPKMRPDMLVRARFMPMPQPQSAPAGDGNAAAKPPTVERWFVPREALVVDAVGTAVMVYDPRGKFRGEGVARRIAVDRRDDGPDGTVEVAGALSRSHHVILAP
ncbi:MAG: efflux RND transporter periplasmic adaptor subunit, partial [Planctomycetota bacterium]